MNRHRAFTLVELLVILGIIAMLSAILLPVIHRAGEESQLVVCAQNLKMIGDATLKYVADNQGLLPQRQDDGIEPMNPSGGAGSPLYLTRLNFRRLSKFEINADPGPPLASLPPTWKDPGANIGRLIIAGYLGDTELKGRKAVGDKPGSHDPSDFYLARNDATVAPFRFCPSQMIHLQPMLLRQSSYLFNPHWFNMKPGMPLAFGRDRAMDPGPIPSPTRGYQGMGTAVTAFTRLSEYPKNFCLVCDMCVDIYLTTFHEQPDNVTTWNLLFPDGSVKSVKYAAMGRIIFSRGPDNGFYRMDDYIDILETVAAGDDPATKTATGFPPMSPSSAPDRPSLFREGAYHAAHFVNHD